MLIAEWIAAKQIPGFEIVVAFRKGNQGGLLGMREGELINDNAGFQRVLMPIVNGL